MICCMVCILAVPPMVQAADHANEKRWCRSRKICDRIALYKEQWGMLE